LGFSKDLKETLGILSIGPSAGWGEILPQRANVTVYVFLRIIIPLSMPLLSEHEIMTEILLELFRQALKKLGFN